MKINEEYVIICSLDMKDLVSNLVKRYQKEITNEELEYYRRNLKPSRLQHKIFCILYICFFSDRSFFYISCKNKN